MQHRDKLQREFNEVVATMPDAQKVRLNETMKKLPTSRQEQLVAELVANHQRRQSLSEEERKAEDMEMV